MSSSDMVPEHTKRGRELVVVLDFGAQYNQLIARRVRENQVYCHLVPYTISAEELEQLAPRGIILSGGPASVNTPGAPLPDPKVFELGIPVLGICYGMQVLGKILGAPIGAAPAREYGGNQLTIVEPNQLFHQIPSPLKVWMSHSDHVLVLPPGCRALARTDNCALAGMMHAGRRLYGVQFHPEVAHTDRGSDIIRNFLFQICGCSGDWTMRSFVDDAVERIRTTVGQKNVICALSGGVDSSVTAMLIHRAVARQLQCIFVDNGLLREGEAEDVIETFRDHFSLNLQGVDAADRFLEKLKGVTDPEEKRKRIGREFIAVFTEAANRHGDIDYLAQGTLYPDVIESVSPHGGPSVCIKSHHNVGGLPEHMDLALLEPLRDLFKDEVRNVGRELGLPERIVNRQPFPGPGLAIRIIGEVTPERLAILRAADVRVREEMEDYPGYAGIWQSFAVLLPIRSVGVMGDQRSYGHTIVLRAVTSRDAMTADWARLPDDLLERISHRVINEVDGVNRVVYDISSKPPSTIEWE